MIQIDEITSTSQNPVFLPCAPTHHELDPDNVKFKPSSVHTFHETKARLKSLFPPLCVSFVLQDSRRDSQTQWDNYEAQKAGESLPLCATRWDVSSLVTSGSEDVERWRKRSKLLFSRSKSAAVVYVLPGVLLSPFVVKHKRQLTCC